MSELAPATMPRGRSCLRFASFPPHSLMSLSGRINLKREMTMRISVGVKRGRARQGGAGPRREYVDGNRIHIEVPQRQGQLDPLFHRFAQADDPAAACAEAGFFGRCYGIDILLIIMGGADSRVKAPGSLQIVMVPEQSCRPEFLPPPPQTGGPARRTAAFPGP